MTLSAELSRLVTWTHAPDAGTIAVILAALTPADMLMAMTMLKNTPAGRIAWAEYGRRSGFIDFELKTCIAAGRLEVAFEGPAAPAHHGPAFQIKE